MGWSLLTLMDPWDQHPEQPAPRAPVTSSQTPAPSLLLHLGPAGSLARAHLPHLLQLHTPGTLASSGAAPHSFSAHGAAHATSNVGSTHLTQLSSQHWIPSSALLLRPRQSPQGRVLSVLQEDLKRPDWERGILSVFPCLPGKLGSLKQNYGREECFHPLKKDPGLGS